MTQFVLAGVLGTLFALGTFLVLRRDVVRVVWGVSIISQAANVYLVTMGGLTGGAPVGGFGGHGGADPATATDPLVQALVLTAIVIGFGTTALALVLTYRVYEEHGTIDVYELGADAEADAAADEGNAGADGPLRSDGGGGGRVRGDGTAAGTAPNPGEEGGDRR